MLTYSDNMTPKQQAEFLAQERELDTAYADADAAERAANTPPNPFEGIGGYNAAHRGLAGYYSEHEAALLAALATEQPFDTRWYSVKHESQSGRVWSDDGCDVFVQASVTDDFDTEGKSDPELVKATHDGDDPAQIGLREIDEAFDVALAQALSAQADNVTVAAFSLGKQRRGAWSCVEYYLLPQGDGYGMAAPPGDHYHNWGWQYDDSGKRPDPRYRLPVAIRAQLEAWANGYYIAANESLNADEEIVLGKWRLRRW